MTNIASVLKAEIARVARKEVRAEMEGLKRAAVQHRSAIAQLRRQVADLEKQLKEIGRKKSSESRARDATGPEVLRRFSATRLAAHRSKLGLSAAAYGKLVGMSGATIYLWEQGKSRPNSEQVKQLAAVRPLSRRAVLEQLSG